MKKSIFAALCIGTWAWNAATPALAHPFRTRFVCVPQVAADQVPLEFRIRDQGTCAENELYMEVRPQGDGSTLLLPAVDALSPEEQRDLDRYRKFFGASPAPRENR